jgi:mono/diheme cytochrome c family protein
MIRLSGRIIFGLILGWSALAFAAAKPKPAASGNIDFNRDIRTILSDNCFACHGPDENKRKAKLRFDIKEGAFKETKSGNFAIVPGDISKSKLVERITSKDPDEVMPPPKSSKKLTPQQIDL